MDITTTAQDVLELILAEGQSLPADVNAAERMIQDKTRQIGQAALQLHLSNLKKLGYEGSSRACECGRSQKFVGYRSRTLATLLGAVHYRRAYYHCRHCGQGCCPSDQEAKLGDCQASLNLAKAATLLAVNDPFSPSARILRELTGVRLGDRTIQRLTRRAGQVADQQERDLALRMATWNAPTALAKPKRLYIAVDGAFIHLEDGWHDVKCVACWWEDAKGKLHKNGVVRRATAEEFKAFVWALACQCGLEEATEVVLLGDGAAWIWEHMAGVLGEKTICITGWYHVTEHLWSCAKTLFGEATEGKASATEGKASATEVARAWEQELETLLWKGKSAEVLGLLRQDRASRRGGKRAAVEGLITYLENQGNRLNYAEFRERGLDIGSGRVEAMCKQVGVRMKRNGMRWSEPGAQAVLSLRSTWLNGQWDEFWNQRPLAA
jgi:hypothetical protein